MKLKILHIFIFSALLLSFSQTIHAQCDTPTITTDWRKSNTSNTEHFDWVGSEYPNQAYRPVYLHDNLATPTMTIPLPYFCYLTNCPNLNLNPEYDLGINPADHDIHPEDGWELVKYDFGTPNHLDDQSNVVTGRKTDNPVIILYNRYTGKIKVFVCLIGKQTSIQSAEINIAFIAPAGYRRTALFSHAGPIMHVLDEFNNLYDFHTLNQIQVQNFEDGYQWLFAEMQTAYDPCTCHNIENLLSKINIQVNLLATTTISAKIEGVETQKLINNGVTQPEDFGKSFFNTLNGTFSAALKGYKTWDAYKSQANTIYNDYNSFYTDQLVKDWWKDSLKKNPSISGTYNFSQQKAFFGTFTSSNKNYSHMMGMDNMNKYEKAGQIIKGIASAFPYIGTAVGIYEYLSGGSDKKNTTATPTIFNSSYKLTGTFNQISSAAIYPFITPQSYYTGNPEPGLFTMYKNVLGVFNILNQPTFEQLNLKPSTITPVGTYTHDIQNPGFSFDQISNNIIREFRVKDNIKYVINPASHLEVKLIDAALVIEYTGNQGWYFNKNHLNSIPFYPGCNDATLSMAQRLENMRKAGLSIDYMSANYPSGANAIIRLRTDYVPLSCLQNLSIALMNGGGYPPKVYLKLLVKFKRTDAGSEATEYTEISMYDITENFSNPTLLQTEGAYNVTVTQGVDEGQMPWNDFTYVNTMITSDPFHNPYNTGNLTNIDVTYMYGQTDTIYTSGIITIPSNSVVANYAQLKSEGPILIGDNVTFGHDVTLISGTKITLGIGVINQPATMYIQPLSTFYYGCESSDVSAFKATQSEIDAVCTSPKYIINATQYSAPEVVKKEKAKEKVYFNLFPNPAIDVLNYDLNYNSEENYTLEISDMTGRMLMDQNFPAPDGKTRSINVSSLKQGIYIIIIKSLNFSVTSKFVIMK